MKIAFTTITILITAIFSATLAVTLQSANAICSESGCANTHITPNGAVFTGANNFLHNTHADTSVVSSRHIGTLAATNEGFITAATSLNPNHRACVVKNGNTICA